LIKKIPWKTGSKMQKVERGSTNVVGGKGKKQKSEKWKTATGQESVLALSLRVQGGRREEH